MRHKLLTVVLAVTVIASLVVAGCAKPAPAPAPAPGPAPTQTPLPEKPLPEVEITWVSPVPAGSPVYQMLDEEPAALMEKVTHGRAKITMYPVGTLVTGPDMYQAIQEGVADFGWVYAAFNPGAFPMTDLFTLPALFPNVSVSNQCLNVLFNEYPQFKEQFSPKVKHISTNVMLRPLIHSSVPIRTLDDLKGKVIGCQDALSAKALNKLGASASVVPIPDMYTSGETGVVDGVVIAWGAFLNWNLFEVYKYHTIVYFSQSNSHYVMNRNTWEKFAPEDQERIELLAPWLQAAVTKGTAIGTGMDRAEADLEAKGHEEFYWTEEEMTRTRELVRPIWDEWAEEMEAKGYPGKELITRSEELIKWYSAK